MINILKRDSVKLVHEYTCAYKEDSDMLDLHTVANACVCGGGGGGGGGEGRGGGSVELFSNHCVEKIMRFIDFCVIFSVQSRNDF